jgi:hypothetical protein
MDALNEFEIGKTTEVKVKREDVILTKTVTFE